MSQALQSGFDSAPVSHFTEDIHQGGKGKGVEIFAKIPEQEFLSLFPFATCESADGADADSGIRVFQCLNKRVYTAGMAQIAQGFSGFAVDIRVVVKQLFYQGLGGQFRASFTQGVSCTATHPGASVGQGLNRFAQWRGGCPIYPEPGWPEPGVPH